MDSITFTGGNINTIPKSSTCHPNRETLHISFALGKMKIMAWSFMVVMDNSVYGEVAIENLGLR